jgi:hypothetical protein
MVLYRQVLNAGIGERGDLFDPSNQAWQVDGVCFCALSGSLQRSGDQLAQVYPGGPNTCRVLAMLSCGDDCCLQATLDIDLTAVIVGIR